MTDSLYNLVLNCLGKRAEPLQVSLFTLRSTMGAMIDLLIERQISAQLWVKLPQHAEWFSELNRYSEAVETATIYWMGNESGTPIDPSQRWQRLALPTQSAMQREFWLAIASESLNAIVVAHQPPLKVAGEDLNPPLLALISFETATLEKAIRHLGKADLGMLNRDPEQALLVLHSLVPQLIQRLQAAAQPMAIAPELSSSTEAEVLLEELRSKDRFVNNVVQELRMPLTNMIAALTLLNSPKLRPDQRQRYFNLLNNECNRQRSLIDSLLDLLELERTQEQVQLRRVLLSEVIPGVVSTYQPIAREKGITLGYTIPNNLPPVSCLDHWLRQITVKLLQNAIKFTPAGGQVQAIAKQHGDFVEIEFQDTGIGIPRHELPHIFDRFYRVRASASESGEDLSPELSTGTGLGLAIVRQLLLCCGGSITVNSQVGKGSVFKVLLPIYR
ncbi:MAG: hypothetical protein F6K32_11905 [Desertifilum sp. SIO1I2]|nr:hypothetical protein [Desertifilum sp. SIO1I2]